MLKVILMVVIPGSTNIHLLLFATAVGRKAKIIMN